MQEEMVLMKAVVLYDSVYGNTEKVAKAIAGGVGPGCEARRISSGVPGLKGVDMLIVGSPTHGGRPTKPVGDFLQRMPGGALGGVGVACFDTRNDLEGEGPFVRKIVDFFGYAATSISKILEKKGGRILAPPEGFFVEGKEGPMKEGEIERATAWGRKLAGRP